MPRYQTVTCLGRVALLVPISQRPPAERRRPRSSRSGRRPVRGTEPPRRGTDRGVPAPADSRPRPARRRHRPPHAARRRTPPRHPCRGLAPASRCESRYPLPRFVTSLSIAVKLWPVATAQPASRGGGSPWECHAIIPVASEDVVGRPSERPGGALTVL